MPQFSWKNLPLVDRIRWLRYILPPTIALIVIIYQLGVAQTLHDEFGHLAHYLVEIAFYSLLGPLVTWITLVWVENGLREKNALERQVRAQTHQLTSLAAASADAIISLDHNSRITSWNQGAQRMFGYIESEITGQPLSKLLLDTTVLEERLQRLGVVQNFETTAVAQDGHKVTVDLTQTRMQADTADVPVSLLIMRDITTRREREAILEEERARIARDLHDGVAQTLYFLALKADMAQEQIAQNPQDVAAELKEIGRESRRVIREVRRTIFALQPLDWSQGEFLPALRDFVERFAEQVGWQISFDVDEPLTLPPRMEPTIFRIIQESLNNVAKHSPATHVQVQLSHIDNSPRLSLTIKDDGQGFDLAKITNSGFGLGQMRRRVETLGGDFSIESHGGRGTTVRAYLPLLGVFNESH